MAIIRQYVLQKINKKLILRPLLRDQHFSDLSKVVSIIASWEKRRKFQYPEAQLPQIKHNFLPERINGGEPNIFLPQVVSK